MMLNAPNFRWSEQFQAASLSMISHIKQPIGTLFSIQTLCQDFHLETASFSYSKKVHSVMKFQMPQQKPTMLIYLWASVVCNKYM